MMKFLGKLFSKQAPQQTMDLSVLLELIERQAGDVGVTYESAARNAYMKSGVTFRSLRLVFSGISSAPILLYQWRGNDRVELPREHPLLQLLRKPNPKDLTWQRYVMRLGLHLYLGGEAAIWRVRGEGLSTPSGKKVVALWVMHAARFSLAVSGDERQGYLYGGMGMPGVGNGMQSYPFEDVLFLRFMHPTNDNSGFSPVHAAGSSISQGNSARTWNNNLLKNGARPPGILRSKFPIENPEQRKAIIDGFIAKYGGTAGAGMPFLEGELEYQATGFAPTDMDWLKGQQAADRAAAYTLGVPSQLLGDKDASTYANMREARKALYLDEVCPTTDWILAEFTQWLAPSFGEGLELEADWDQVEALQENRAETWDRLGKIDVLSVNEKRAALGYDEVPGDGGGLILTTRGVVITADGKVYMPATLIEVGAEEEPEPKPSPAPPKKEAPEDDLESVDSPFNIGTEKRKAAFWRAFDRKRDPYVRAARLLVAARFQKERQAVAESMHGLSITMDVVPAVESIITNGVVAWFETYRKIYLVTGLPFFRGVVRGIPKALSLPLATKIIQEGDEEDIWAATVAEHIATQAGTKIVGIGQTTLERVRKVLAEGEAAGESITQIAERLDQLYLREIIPNRSEVIARTETANSSNMASHEAAKMTGAAAKKIWISTRDERARTDHWNPETNGADGQKVLMEDPFVVGGFQLMWPGDVSMGAPAEQVINCRCTLGYETNL